MCGIAGMVRFDQKPAEADLLLFPSLLEGFGLPIREAQIAGRPIITNNKSLMKEVSGKEAFLVNPFNAVSSRNGILRLLQEPAYRDQLILEGFQNIKKKEVPVIVQQYLELYYSLAD